MTTVVPGESWILLHRMLENSTYSSSAISMDALTNTECINGFLPLNRVCPLIRRFLNYYTASKCDCCLISRVNGHWGAKNRECSGAFNTLTLLMCKGCLCMCASQCRWISVGMLMHGRGDAQNVRAKFWICVCVVLHLRAQCSRPTIIRAASHTDLVA